LSALPKRCTNNCAGSRVANAHPARAQARAGEDAAQGETQDARDQRGFAREQKAGPPRQRQHPLAHRNVRQDAIDQVRGSALHSSRRAGRTDPTGLARERDEQLVAAGDAAHASESVGENAAPEVSLEVGHDETGQPASVVLHLRQERLEVPPDGFVQERRLRLATAISRSSSGGLPSFFFPSGVRRNCLGAVQGARGIS
jgi:hypothetical protein